MWHERDLIPKQERLQKTALYTPRRSVLIFRMETRIQFQDLPHHLTKNQLSFKPAAHGAIRQEGGLILSILPPNQGVR